MSWYLVPSLVALRDQANAMWPNRDKSSDGSIGDAAHSSRTSDHNPDPVTGAVRAYDLDEDLDGTDDESGAELMSFAEHLRSTRDPRIKYVIYEGRMFSSYPTSAYPAWTWRPYSGTSNPHTKHMHVSVLSTATGENDTRSWFPTVQEDDFDMRTDDQIKALVRSVLNEGTAYGTTSWAQTSKSTVSKLNKVYNLVVANKVDYELLADMIVQRIPEGEAVDQATVEAGVKAVFAELAVAN
jgi:hypothetical protein